MRLDALNALDADAAALELVKCCGSPRWAERMAARRPFASAEAMAGAADSVFDTLDRGDWLAAFAAHPRIGARMPGPASRSTKAERGSDLDWSAHEQAGAADAADHTLVRLADMNRDYEARFGYIFIVCATGKTAAEMLELLEQRIGNGPQIELRIAATEQRKITRLRLMKLIDGKQDMTR